LDGITLAFLPGAKIGVIGHNGSGKSTLLRIMAGEDQEYDGLARPADGNTDPDTAVGNNAAELLMGEFGKREDVASPPAPAAGEWLYALYAWPVFVLLGLLAWLLVVLTPTEGGRRKMGHWCARLLFRLTLTPLEVHGHEHLDPHSAQIIVANHASYLDGFIVTASLDIPIHFIVKGELAGNHAIRIILQRFGVEFVDRFNASKGRSDVKRIADKARRGQSIVFFPEGTFTAFEGLQPFRMGAFVTACRANVPVVPVAISGARPIIRGSDWFPRRGHIRVTVCPPIMPAANNWQAALDLRDAARRELAPHTGEPDLVED
ncbi:MAG: 1-acyl-sn-glycerol-3-phosphate acyltransferase, partial [Thiohalobacterales bacterium]|nr:1-acyl-sn-glycerol-3-phosphate acyltransferase [Thiohalobacterales bacterium]